MLSPKVPTPESERARKNMPNHVVKSEEKKELMSAKDYKDFIS